jgi:omega-amidase
MKITIVQPDTVWEDKAANFKNIGRIINNLPEETDIVVLPEMFATGFSLNAEILAEEYNGETFNWMRNLSQSNKFSICGSFILRSEGKFYNHFLFGSPQNEVYSYDKRHLFSLAGENEIFENGKIRQVFTYKTFRFLPLICYDLRFPAWIRNREDYDAIICIASWPEIRGEAWNILLRARAIENQCFVIGVNRTGFDNEGLRYAGDSVVIDPLGQVICKVNKYEEGAATVEISLSELQNLRTKFPVWKDADNFSLNL